MHLHVSTEDVGGRTVVRAVGEVDVASGDRLRDALARAVTDGRKDLVVDLTGITFMDSTGLGILVGALKRVRLAGGTLELVISSERLLKVFRITGLTGLFTIHPTRDAVLGPREG